MENSVEFVFHEEVELEQFEFDEESKTYTYPCPCGDRFEITKEELEAGEDVAVCPSCSLMVRVIYDVDVFRASNFVDNATVSVVLMD
ncbi:DPH-type domain-containing protein [Meloidogyne graminicola]|uniref:Diphthamide biosynthesis protein 3 n=1 Tax=Meloidogyne graminicola TaxID=189291 RepID=A0A8S9ZPB5_9BILA|nr:DPH-type domain-containing protein [Meloidogyne graminicola]